MCLFMCLLVYTIVLVLSVATLMAEDKLKTSSDCVKVIFLANYCSCFSYWYDIVGIDLGTKKII